MSLSQGFGKLEPRVAVVEAVGKEMETQVFDTGNKVHTVEDRMQRTLAFELAALEQRCENVEEKWQRAEAALGRLQDAMAAIEVVARTGETRSGEVDIKLDRACRALRQELTGVAGEVHKVNSSQDSLRLLLHDAQNELDGYRTDNEKMLSKSTANLQAVRQMGSRLGSAIDRTLSPTSSR
jgi:predicted  nucleic acid-binding Zn-ribbon protein